MPNQTVEPQHNLAVSIGRNTLFGVLSNLAQIGTRLLTVPIVIHYLGLGGYGIWNIIMTSAAYMRFGGVGVKTAFQKYVAEATGNGDYERANKLLSTGCALMLALSLLVLIPVSFFSTSIAKLGGVPAEFLFPAAKSISLLAVTMLIANVGAVYEAVVLGGHRIDLARKFGTVLTVAEAAAVIIFLRLGFGLLAMAGVMGVSELLYILCCYFAAHRVLPKVRIGFEYLDRSMLRELFRFAGSYQLLSFLEIVYGSIIPFAVLRMFGANVLGIFGVVTRVAASAVMLQDAFLIPILSGGTMVFASGSIEKMQALTTKAFKVTCALALLPLSFIAAFGPTMAYAWTGQRDPRFGITFCLICLGLVFRSFSRLSAVLYRTAGRASLDNVLQILRSVILVGIAVFSRKLGFDGLLAGTAATEFFGMAFMVFALTRTFHLFRAKDLIPDVLRMAVSTSVILAAGMLASCVPNPADLGGRLLAGVKLLEISVASLLVAWPSLLYTGSVTASEGRALFHAFLPSRPAIAHHAGD
jgi:O-antigen/teichoic acid export membrane protein